MRNILCFWGVIVIGYSGFSNGYEYDEYLNATEVSFQDSVFGVSAAAYNPLLVGLTIIQGAGAQGAVCLDGTLPGYHLHPGYGSGANSWLIQLEGGGWCYSIRSCVYRKKTRRGSLNYMEKELVFAGILSNKAEENPDFFNWNRVKLRYCDGASFAGDSENKIGDFDAGASEEYEQDHAELAELSDSALMALSYLKRKDRLRGSRRRAPRMGSAC